MRVGKATRPDGSEILVTLYDDNSVSIAEKPAPHLYPHRSWGPPMDVSFEAPYDYRTREIEDILTRHGVLS